MGAINRWSVAGVAFGFAVLLLPPFAATAPVPILPPPTNYFTLEPACRVFDSRVGSPVTSGTPVTVTVEGGVCGVPADAVGVAFNVTVIGPTNPGEFTVFENGKPLPPAPTIHFSSGQTRSNNGIVTLSAAGAVSGQPTLTPPSGTVHFLLDVVGYFVEDIPPVAVDDSATVTEDDLAAAIDVLANDTDADGGPIAIASASDPANGTVVLTGGTPGQHTGLTYQPDPNYCNSVSGPLDTFNYTLSPGGSSTTVSVTVTCVDDPPVAVDDAVTVNEDSGANTLNLQGNDTDIDAGPKAVLTVSDPPNGTATVVGGNAVYTPDLNYCNGSSAPSGTPDTFTYTLTPGGDSGSVSVTVICLNDPPVADNDAFDFIGNTQLEVDQDTASTPEALETTPSTFGVIDGDSDPVEGNAIAVTSITVGACTDNTGPTFDCTDAAVGTVNMEANGRFSFLPAPGDTGASESFTYILTDNGTPPASAAPATVTITRFERVWYVKNDAAAGGLGRSHDPFDTLVEAQTASAAGDYLFVYFGDGTAVDQAAGIVLKNAQHLIGEHAGLSIPVNLNGNGSPTVLHAGTPGSRPLLDDTVGGAPEGVSAIDVIPIEIVGLNLAGNVNAIEWTTTGPFAGTGTLSIRDNIVRSATNEGVDVNLAGTGATNLAFHDNNLTSTGTALDVVEAGAGALTITAFHDNVVTGNSAGAGINVVTARFDVTPGGGVDPVPGGTTVIGDPGNPIGGAGFTLVSATGALNFANAAAGTIGAGDLDIFSATGAALSVVGGVGGFDLDVTPNAGVLLSNAGPAAVIFAADVDLQLNSLFSANSSSTGVSLTNVTGTFSAPIGSSIDNAATIDFEISGGAASVTYGGTITDDVGQLVSVSNTTGGTKSFSGAITDLNDGDGSGIALSNNNAAVNFSGKLTLNTGTNPAFSATGATGTVTATHGDNTIVTTSGTALNVNGPDIGVGGLVFDSIAANGAASGIILQDTGATAGLTVTGTGSADSGGTIQSCTGDCVLLTNVQDVSLTELQISNAAGSAVDATNVLRLTLDSVDIATTGDSGIRGTTVTDFKFQNGSTMTGGGNAANEHGIFITDLFGANSAITNSSVTGSAVINVHVINNNATAGTLTISNSTLNNTAAATGGDGVSLVGNNSANLTGNLTGGNNLNNNQGDGIQVSANNSSIVKVTVNGATSDYNGNLGSAVNIAAADSAAITALVSGFTGVSTGTGAANGLNVINIQNFNTSTINATVQNNVISGLGNNASGIRVIQEANGAIHASLSSNTITGFVANGIVAQARAGTGSLNLTGSNNNINLASALALDGVSIESGSSAGGDTNTICMNMTNNTSAAAAQQGYRLRQRSGTTFRLQNFGSAPCGVNGASTTDVSCWVNTTKINTGTTDIVIGTAFSVAPANCPTPSLP